MTNIATFNYLSNSVRVLIVDSQPWFIAVDVCQVLDLGTKRRGASNHTRRLAADELMMFTNENTPNLFVGKRGYPRLSAVSESGLYKLVMRSDNRRPASFRTG
jgi:prophage antirepressor-like protein